VIGLYKKQGQINDILNLIVGGIVAAFLTILGATLLIGLFFERDKAEAFLILLGFGLLFSGIGCTVYCFYVWYKRGVKLLYRISVILAVTGFIFALIALWLYENG
jgi:xanthine/uracil permease